MKYTEDNSPDPKIPISKINVEDLVDGDLFGNWHLN